MSKALLNMVFILLAFAVSAKAQTTTSFDFFKAKEKVVYLSKQSSQKAVRSLGGASFRKSYEELDLPKSEIMVFHVLRHLLQNYPNAVVTRGKLVFKTDDNCTAVGDWMDGVNIAEACRNHDYCYRDLSGARNNSEVRVHFDQCNQKLTSDIHEMCEEESKICAVNRIYTSVIEMASMPFYRFGQCRQALMMRDVLLKSNQAAEDILRQSGLFDFAEMKKNYVNYCDWISQKVTAREMLLPCESRACVPYTEF